jgi:hypothetical protein
MAWGAMAYQEGERGEGYGKPRHEAADLDDG